jgi:adenylate cyclase
MDEARTEAALLIVFVSLDGFAVQCERLGDPEIAQGLDAYYHQVAAAVQAAGGRVVKVMGDGVLIVFPEPALDRGVQLLQPMKQAVDDALTARGWACQFVARAHFGTVLTGPFGPPGGERFDVVGRAVNTAARLRGGPIALSEPLVRRLGNP